MPWHNFLQPVVAIIGPTGVGKTALAVELAEHFNGEIVSADSRQFYRGMDIGTAKPSAKELERIPHHLIDVSEPDETWSLAAFKREASAAIADIQGRGKLPFLVGGTGQYIYGLLEDWQIPNQEPDDLLREILERWGREIGPYSIHQKLAILDAEAAKAIQPENLRRTVRALEVIFRSGHRFSEQRRVGKSPYSVLKIGLILPRSALYARVDARIAAMLEDGLVGEVNQLRQEGYAPDLPTLSAIGYREISAYLDGEMSLDDAVTAMKRLTRDYIRRQANWFKQDDPTIHWVEAGEFAFLTACSLIETDANWIFPE